MYFLVVCQSAQIEQIALLRSSEDPTKLRGFAFVHYTDRASALRAMTEVESGKVFELQGKPLSVALAKPQPSAGDGPRGGPGHGPRHDDYGGGYHRSQPGYTGGSGR